MPSPIKEILEDITPTKSEPLKSPPRVMKVNYMPVFKKTYCGVELEYDPDHFEEMEARERAKEREQKLEAEANEKLDAEAKPESKTKAAEDTPVGQAYFHRKYNQILEEDARALKRSKTAFFSQNTVDLAEEILRCDEELMPCSQHRAETAPRRNLLQELESAPP